MIKTTKTLKTYKTLVTDKRTKEKCFIESDYPSKQAFIKDLRANGYRVNDIRVAEVNIYNYILDNTNATDEDFRKIKEI